MPTIKRTSPLIPEGEYVGQARKVSLEWVKARNGEEEEVQAFKIPLHTHDGKMVVAFARVTEATGWIFETICKSGEIQVPDEAEEITLQPDHLERRRFFFAVKHNDYDGRRYANVRFHAPSYAIGINPALAQVTFPNEAVRPLVLESAKATSKSEEPLKNTYDQDDISDEEMKQAIEHVKSLHSKKD